MRAPSLAEKIGLTLLALLLGALAGYVDMVEKGVYLPALILLSAAFLLGSLGPRQAWLWAVIVGLSIPAAHGVGAVIGHPPPYAAEVLPMTVIPVIFAFLAALIGAFLRWVLDSALLARAPNGE